MNALFRNLNLALRIFIVSIPFLFFLPLQTSYAYVPDVGPSKCVANCPSGSSSSSSSSSWSSSSGYSSGYGYTGPSLLERIQQKLQQRRERKAVELNDTGVQYQNAGDLEKSIEYYEKAYAKDPSNSVIWRNLQSARGSQWNKTGLQSYEKGDWGNAIQAFERALQLKPESDVIRQNLENARYQLRQAQELKRKEEEQERVAERLRETLPSLALEIQSSQRPSSLGFEGLAPLDTTAQDSISPAPPAGSGGLEFMDVPRTIKLEGFKHMNPTRQPMLERGTMPAGGSPTASGQAESAQFHSQSASGQPTGEGMKGEARLGFDTAGVPKEGLKPLEYEGIPPYERDPEIPSEKITPAIQKLVEKRTGVRSNRRGLESQLERLEQAEKRDLVAIVKLKDQISRAQHEEIFLNFSIHEELAKAPDVRRPARP